MSKGLSFVEAWPTAPTLFHYIVLEEEHWTCELMIATKKMYCAVAMEWYQTAQGDTPEAAIEGLERMLMANAAIKIDHPDHNPMAAPEEYQRVATAGDFYVMADPKWIEFCGRDRYPIVARGVIDMAKCTMRIVPAADA